MIYIFDKTQAIIKVLTNDDFTAAHLNFKINTATTFEFSLPASKALPSGSKYVATPHPLDDSKFIMLRLTERVDNTETIDYSAYELAYQELATDGYIEDKRPQNQSALNLMKIALDGTNWELNNVNVSGTATTNFYYLDHLSAISNVVDLLGGEIVFYIEIQGNAISGRYMDYLARQGADTSKVFASGSNLLTVERQSDTSNIYTAILPRGKGEEIDNGDADTPDGYGRRINIYDVEWTKSSGKPLDKPKGSIVLSDPDATSEWGQINGNARLLLQTYDDIDDVNVLINSAYKTLQSVNHPQIQYSATVADVGGLSLGDTVLIMHGDRDLSYKTRVFEVKYDLLSPDQTELSLGDDLSSNSITSQINSLNAVADTTSSQTQWTINQIGRPSTTFGNTEPANPKVGDVFFKELPDGGTEIYRWNGDIWELLASPTTADDIADAVTDAVTQAKAHSDKLVADNVAQVNTVLDDVQAKQADLTAQQAELDTKAQGYADKALADAKANTLATATQTAKDAQDALAKAKTDLTTSLNKEVTDRANAVTALDTKAKGYADTAKADAISASTAADGVINKKIDDTASSITSTISQNKTDADGKITTAQSTATQALNGLATKVSQTVYDSKTGQLQTDLNTTTTTANQAKTDIVAIKSDNTKQDARMTTIESDANGTKTTVSNLQTDLGKANGSISTLQQRADGFEATVSTLGQINQLLNTEFTPDFAGWYTSTNANPTDVVTTQLTPIGTDGFGSNQVSHKGGGSWINSAPIPVTPGMVLSFSTRVAVPKPVASGVPLALYIMAFDTNNGRVLSMGYNLPVNQLTTTPTIFKLENIVMPAGAVKAFAVYAWNVGDEVYISQPMLVFKDKVGAYVQGAYSNSISTAKAQLTADQATTSLNNYRNDADGRISKAQADIIVNANAITTKVSQSDYNAKTGDLTTKVNTAQSTADSATSTIGSYKTSNDERVASAESKITANANAITQKVSQTDYNQKTGELSGSISTLKQRADGFDTTVTKVNNLSVGGRNLLLDTATRTAVGPNVANNTPNAFRWTLANNATVGSLYTAWGNNTPISVSFDWSITGTNIAGAFNPQWNGAPWGIGATGAPGITVGSTNTSGHYTWSSTTQSGWSSSTANQFTLRTDNLQGTLTITNLKFEQGNLPTAWSPAPEDTDNKISTVSQTVDSISSIVSDPTTGLTKRVQTAEGTLSQVTGADIPNLKKATFWQPYSSLDFNSYTKQGSFFFNTTSTKTNGPTTSNSWIYLIVEQGTSDNGRVKQTAWYDGVTGVKITYVRTLNSGTWSPWYANDNDSVATIAQTNGAIQTEISNRATGDTNTLTQAKDFTTSSISNSESGMRSQITQTSDAILAKIEATNMVVNSEFDPLDGTWYQITTGAPAGATVGTAWNAPQAGSFQDWPVINGSRIITYASANWYTSTLMVTSAGKAFSASIVAGRSPAPTVSTALDFRIAFWDGNRALISTMSGGNIIDGTVYKGVQKYVVENKIAPANTKYVSVVIAHSSANATDFISRPVLNVGAKASPYTPTYGTTASSTVLSLLKDNWSIGIADNAGAITNGIVGNSTNMSLISNNVVINAPSTQIKGTAWINSAMIGNGQIGTAQIGDAAITSAKIANLDVSKITGDVTNFVKSGWNNAYGSNVTIDGTGMVVSYGNTSTFFENGNVLFKQLADYADGSNQVETIGSISTTHNGTVNNIVIGLYDQTHIPFGSADGKKIGSPTGEIYGGDLIAFGKARDFNGNFDHIFSYSNQTASLKYGITEGFNFRDKVNFNSNEIVSGSVNYNLKIGALKFSGKFDGRYVPVIVATWSGYIGGGIAFGGDNVVAFNQTQATIIS